VRPVTNIESNIAGRYATRYDVFNGVEVILYKKAGSRKCNVLFCFTGCYAAYCSVPEAEKLLIII